MISERFFCRDCNKYFDNVKIYEETHGLDSPPYERVSVCPYCESDNFTEFDIFIEKYEVAEKTLPAIILLNKQINGVRDLFGIIGEKSDLENARGYLVDMLCDMFDCFDYDFSGELNDMCTGYDLEKVMMKFEDLG